MSPFACVRDTDRCGPLSRCPSSMALEFERLLVSRSSPEFFCVYEGSIGMTGGWGAGRAGVRGGKVGIPGGRGAGRPGIRVTWLVDGLAGALRGIGGAARGCSKLPSLF